MTALTKRLDELTKAASPGPWRVVGGNRIAIIANDRAFRLAEFYGMYDGKQLPHEANAALAAPAHEMAACVTALVEAVEAMQSGVDSTYIRSLGEFEDIATRGRTRLAALAKAFGVSDE